MEAMDVVIENRVEMGSEMSEVLFECLDRYVVDEIFALLTLQVRGSPAASRAGVSFPRRGKGLA
jgi:hypothetical protein